MKLQKAIIYINTFFLIYNFSIISSGWLSSEVYNRIVPHHIPYYMVQASKRTSNYPFITGDTFRSFADFVLDEINLPFDPSEVKPGDAIFLNSHPVVLKEFFEQYHSKIKNPYIIISHNDDLPVPGEFGDYLKEDKIIVWFSKNIDRKHSKLIAIPIGISNPVWVEYGFCDPHLFEKAIEDIPSWEDRLGYFAYLNITVAPNRPGRQHVANYFKDKNFCIKSSPKQFPAYLDDLKKYKFVISPPGHGEDCFRTWEALLMGSIPIVKHSLIDSLFEDLPVIFIDRWEEVTEEFLKEQYNQLCKRTFNRKKLFIDYWIEKINSYKNRLNIK